MSSAPPSALHLPDDPLGAFCRDNHVAAAGSGSGPLVGLSFAVKDVFAVAGARTGFGHPDWLVSHPPAVETARAVADLLAAGADLVGKTFSDELCYSLSGENVHYGTPVNPRAPGRIPGGSSSGSASAVAGGLAEFAIGTDCGGSVRVPASYCGVFGMRPTHGRVPVDGALPFAPSFDCVGWFARDPGVMERVGRVLLADDGPARPFRRLLVAEDAFARADEEVRVALDEAMSCLERAVGPATGVALARDGLEEWFETFRILQAAEIWRSLGGWIEHAGPSFGVGVRERFAAAAAITPAQVEAAAARRLEIAAEVEALIGEGDVVCLPTTPRPPPPLGLAAADVEVAYRNRAMALLCISGLAGLPQLSLPVATVGGAPVGLSVLAARGADIDLLALGARICPAVPAAPAVAA